MRGFWQFNEAVQGLPPDQAGIARRLRDSIRANGSTYPAALEHWPDDPDAMIPVADYLVAQGVFKRDPRTVDRLPPYVTYRFDLGPPPWQPLVDFFTRAVHRLYPRD